MVAVTGATGFLGTHLLPALAASGFKLRVLSRRTVEHSLWKDLELEVVPGDLDNEPALIRLVQGADVVIHMAGLIQARSRKDFLAINRDGAQRLARLVHQHAAGAHLIHVSSLAARAPWLSAYAHSKRAGETAVQDAFPGQLSIVRPPAIYGPWDKATLDIFRVATWPLAPVPGGKHARIAMIHATDAARAIAGLARWQQAPAGGVYALADTCPAGYGPHTIMRMAAHARGRSPIIVPLPGWGVRLAGYAASLFAWLRGRPMVFGAGKAREMLYPLWSVEAKELLPTQVTRPEIDLRQGFAETVEWYTQAGWLP